MHVGVIGTGNMGRILIEAMVESEAVSQASVSIHNRTRSKAENLQQQYPSLTVVDSPEALAERCNLLFLCVKPKDMHALLEKIRPVLTKEQCIVSITSPISVEQLSQMSPCSTARMIPSITNRALAGVSLFTFSKTCTKEWRQMLWTFAEQFSTPLEIDQSITRVASDIISCGPAFYAYMTRRFVQGATKETMIQEETATKLAGEMLIGLGELLKQGHYTLPTLQEKVCVKGGVTGEGIRVLEEELGDVFRHLFLATHEKFDEDVELVNRQFQQSTT
ncbi:late competence protein ComER [Bacillus fonticola]|uniref:late competence protein ComER n=1 Tax=Bacillus fonticola TaxID=2728853 RepID=UPI00147460E4|nr:late competence protein ComER [Bacillus fonticola]